MENKEQHLEALQDIRQLMMKSNKFLSLSGLSGIFAGLYALGGAFIGYCLIEEFVELTRSPEWGIKTLTEKHFRYDFLIIKCVIVCALVLILSLATAIILSGKKAKRNGYKLFDHTTWRLMINMLIPLAAGGVFCIAMLYHSRSYIMLVSPAMLIFYGLALVNGSKYTLNDIRYLGCIEILLGLISCFFLGYGLFFWALGFGVLHIVYGAYMWFKYDRKF